VQPGAGPDRISKQGWQRWLQGRLARVGEAGGTSLGRTAAADPGNSQPRAYWVVDADVQSFFDEIDHDVLLRLVGRRVSDRQNLQTP